MKNDSQERHRLRDASVVTSETGATRMLRAKVEDILDGLAPRQQRLLELRFGLSDGRPRTLAEVAGELGLAPERVSELEAKVLQRLRSSREPDDDPPQARALAG